jgi:hypothetical protein
MYSPAIYSTIIERGAHTETGHPERPVLAIIPVDKFAVSKAHLKANCMPRYFFDLRNDGTDLRDEGGVDVENLQMAVREAALTLADGADDMAAHRIGRESAIEIRDESDRVVAEVRLVIEMKDRPVDG